MYDYYELFGAFVYNMLAHLYFVLQFVAAFFGNAFKAFNGEGGSNIEWIKISFKLLMKNIQGDHLSGKPGNVREFDSCQGNVREFTENQGIVREKILSWKSCLKLFIVNCIFVSTQVLVGVCCVLNVKYNMVSDHALLHSYPNH